MAGNFIANSMRRFGLAPKNKVTPTSAVGGARSNVGNDPLSHMEVGSPYAYATLQYPMDIQSRTDMGHYMMFYINVPSSTKYSRTGKLGSAQKKTSVDTSAGEKAEDDLGKTTDALVIAMTQIEKSNIKVSPSLKEAMNAGEVILKNYYKLSRNRVYEDASKIFDELIKHNNGSSINITKPDWLK